MEYPFADSNRLLDMLMGLSTGCVLMSLPIATCNTIKTMKFFIDRYFIWSCHCLENCYWICLLVWKSAGLLRTTRLAAGTCDRTTKSSIDRYAFYTGFTRTWNNTLTIAFSLWTDPIGIKQVAKLPSDTYCHFETGGWEYRWIHYLSPGLYHTLDNSLLHISYQYLLSPTIRDWICRSILPASLTKPVWRTAPCAQ